MKMEERDQFDTSYGLFKFKRTLPKDLESAMGLVGESVLFKKLIMQNYDEYYRLIDIPEEGDWLSTHKEYGQTYAEYINAGYNSGCVQVDENRDTIYITPLCFLKDDIIDQDFLTKIYQYCQAYFYGMKVRVEQIESNFRSVEAKKYEDGKMQINGKQFLERLSKDVPKNAFCLIGLVDTDFYIENMDHNGHINYKILYEIRNISKRTCIFSFDKFDPLSYVDKSSVSIEKKKRVNDIILKRVCKAITYQICTMFGMKNCIYFNCNMNGVGSLEEIDKRFFDLCPICLRKLYTNIQSKGRDLRTFRVKNCFDLINRLEKMKEVIYENLYDNFELEYQWIEKRLEFLKTLL